MRFSIRSIVSETGAGVTRIANPPAKGSSLVTMVEAKEKGGVAAAFTKTIIRSWRAVFLWRRSLIAT